MFIVGSGRSGNTLIRRGLVEHGGITIPPETYELGVIIRFFLKHNNIDWASIVNYTLGVLSLHPEFDETFGYSLSPLKCRLGKCSKHNQTLSNLLSEFYRFYGERNGVVVTRWGDKTPFNTFSIWDINRVFPTAYYVWIIRDPVDVVASYLKSGIYDNLDSAAQRWFISNKIMLEFEANFPGSVRRIWYQDLVSNYEESIKGLCSYCRLDYGVTPSKSCMGDVEVRGHHSNVMQDVNKMSIGKGWAELDHKEIELIKKLTYALYQRICIASEIDD
ncbi:MAG: sulfotransferase [Gammaproteobacteria bacterium]|nr:sulfotransferase [Gammaproteobacteria bacterium]